MTNKYQSCNEYTTDIDKIVKDFGVFPKYNINNPYGFFIKFDNEGNVIHKVSINFVTNCGFYFIVQCLTKECPYYGKKTNNCPYLKGITLMYKDESMLYLIPKLQITELINNGFEYQLIFNKHNKYTYHDID